MFERQEKIVLELRIKALEEQVKTLAKQLDTLYDLCIRMQKEVSHCTIEHMRY